MIIFYWTFFDVLSDWNMTIEVLILRMSDVLIDHQLGWWRRLGILIFLLNIEMKFFFFNHFPQAIFIHNWNFISWLIRRLLDNQTCRFTTSTDTSPCTTSYSNIDAGKKIEWQCTDQMPVFLHSQTKTNHPVNWSNIAMSWRLRYFPPRDISPYHWLKLPIYFSILWAN